MAITLTQVAYDMASSNELVSTTLQTKKASQFYHGIGPASCWAGVAYYDGTQPAIATGFSQMKNELDGTSPYKNQWVKYHGELAAIARAIEIIRGGGVTSGLLPILGVYVEMSPCPRCAPNIGGLLPDGTTVFYSFDYATESATWLSESKKLCKS